MLRKTLMTAAAATALMAAPAAFAQDQTMTQPATPAPTATPATPAQTPAAPAAAATPAAPAQAAAPAAPAAQANNVVDVLKAQGNFTTLLSALDQAQLTETLASRPEITIFAPTDEAFAALPEADRTRLMDPANAQELRGLLLYHVIVADVSTSQVEGARGPVDTAGGTKLQLDGTGEALKADGATVSAEIDAGNGGIFPIDKVLNPAQSMAAMGDEEAGSTDAAAAPAEGAAPSTTTTSESTSTTTATPAGGSTTSTTTTTTPSAAPAAAPSAAPSATPSATPPASPSITTTTTQPAQPGTMAPSGAPAATTTTTQSPTVPNPTDGQQDDEDEGEDEAPATPQA